MSVGKLTIQLIEAALTHDVQKLGKMDPYVKFEYRDFKWQSEVHEKGGKKPRWTNQKFTVDVVYLGDDVHFKVWDDDRIKDDFVGDGVSKVSAFCVGKGIDEWFEIQWKGESAGKVHLKSTWVPDLKNDLCSQDPIVKAQAEMKALAMKKKELEAEYHTQKEVQAAHEATYEARRASVGEDASAIWDQEKAKVQAQYEQQVAQIEAYNALTENRRQKFEAHIAQANAAHQQAVAELEASAKQEEEEAAAAKVQAEAHLAQERQEADAAKEAHRLQVLEEIRRIEEQDELAHDQIVGQIRAVAEQLLAVTNKVQAKLQAMTQIE